LSEIRCPTLIVIGDRDAWDLPDIADVLERDIPDTEKAVIEDAGHLVPMEKPEEFNRIVLGFLSRRVRPDAAGIPYPPNHATNVRSNPQLSWSAGDEAARHDVYLGTILSDVNNATRDNDPAGVMVSRSQLACSYEPGATDFNTTYHWRIDEVNGPDIWKGPVWSFTTGSYIVVDDFEGYGNASPIFERWLDGTGFPFGTDFPSGYGGNGTRAHVGHGDERWRAMLGNEPIETSLFHSGRQSMPLYYRNTISPFVSRADRVFAEPQDWSRGGIQELTIWVRGNHLLLGGHAYNAATDIHTVTGAGADIWGPSDEFHYVYRRLSGAGMIQARVLSLANTDDPSTTNVWAKAAVMIRQRPRPESAFASVSITPTQGCHFQARRQAGEEAIGDSVGENDVDTDEQNAVTAPYWIRLERNAEGDFIGYYSADGSTWTTMSWSPLSIPMSRDVTIGLAVTSHDVGVQCKAEFSNVTVTGMDGGQVTGDWQSWDVGILSNDREPLYAVIEDDGTDAATVFHPDPNVTVATDWHAWSVDLADQVASAGVDLSNIKQLSIGIGHPQATSAGGEGLIYVDDIRLSVTSPPQESVPR
jgi:hypothetical protein